MEPLWHIVLRLGLIVCTRSRSPTAVTVPKLTESSCVHLCGQGKWNRCILRLASFCKAHQKMVGKCCLREISVFCDKESIFFTEKSNENETLYSGKRSAGQKKKI